MVATVVHHKAPAIAAGMPVDVICAGMYRACSTWQYEVVAHLLEHHRSGRRLGYLTAEEYARESRVDVQCGPRKRPRGGGLEGVQVARRRPLLRPGDRPGASRRGLRLSRRSRRGLLADAQAQADLRAVAPPGDDPPGAGQRPILDPAAGCPDPALRRDPRRPRRRRRGAGPITWGSSRPTARPNASRTSIRSRRTRPGPRPCAVGSSRRASISRSPRTP